MQQPSDNALLHMLQLADSAFPIGAAAHSYGLETLVTMEQLTPSVLPDFLRDYLAEVGLIEASFCHAAYHLGDALSTDTNALTHFMTQWQWLNLCFSAMKPAQESRVASLTLGRRLLQTAWGFMADSPTQPLQQVWQMTKNEGIDVHHATIFGLLMQSIGIAPLSATLAFLQQMVNGLLSACQRLFPLGQNHAMQILWQLAPVIQKTAQQSIDTPVDALYWSSPMLDVASMRHATLPVRLFIS
ncbi:MAG: urease accessory UreF family protein [Chloroflexota bacterium]